MNIDHSNPYNSLTGKRTYTVEEIAKILGITLWWRCQMDALVRKP